MNLETISQTTGAPHELSRGDLLVCDLKDVSRLSSEYHIPAEDIIFIALNLSGIKADIPDSRIRFKLRPKSENEEFYFAVCVNTRETPFEYKAGRIYLGDDEVAEVIDPEKDTCDDTYLRRAGTELTLNSNSRSQCRGCAFCGTYSQGSNDLNSLVTLDRLLNRFSSIANQNKRSDFSDLFRVTICTGCFGTENLALEHILLVNKALSRFGFQGTLRYIGSEIASVNALDIIKENIKNFALSLSVEVFERRRQLLKEPKASMSFQQIKDLLTMGLDRGFRTNILYILGLDPEVKVVEGLRELAPLMNEFPVLNLIQDYLPHHEHLKDPDARSIDYYLRIRREIEKIYKPSTLRPQSWENYRPLWYYTFADEEINGIRI
jgi:hypothetical protein